MLIKNSPNVSVAGEDKIWRESTVNDEPTNQLDHNDSKTLINLSWTYKRGRLKSWVHFKSEHMN